MSTRLELDPEHSRLPDALPLLPLTVLRRIDHVLEPTKEKVLKTYSEFKGKLDNPDDLLRKASGYAFYNTSLYTFERLVDDPQNIAHNLRSYIQSFSPNMREVIEKFDVDNTITKLDDAGSYSRSWRSSPRSTCIRTGCRTP